MLHALLTVALSLVLQTGTSRTVLASVADARNRPFVDLGPDDFVVSEGGQPREVLSYRIADYPIVVLLDTGADARRDFDTIRKAAERFVARLGQRPIVIGTLGDPPAMLSSFEDDRTSLLEQLGAVSARPAGAPSTLEGVAAAARMLTDIGSPFSAIVVVSATSVDNSRSLPRDLVATILRSHAFVHAVANRLAASGARVDLSEPLRGIAEQTGGQFTTIYGSASYEIARDRLADRLATQVMIEYLVPPGSKPIDVRLGVNLPGARVTGLGVAPR